MEGKLEMRSVDEIYIDTLQALLISHVKIFY